MKCLLVYDYCLPVKRPLTYKMVEGELTHEKTAELEQRRSLRAYGLSEGKRQFSIYLHSERLGLTGLLDMLIITPDEVVPVEYKHSTGKLGLNHKYQLAAYSLLVEDQWRHPVRRGFVYFIPEKRAQEMPITPNMRRFVVKTLERIRVVVAEEAMPAPTRHRGHCTDCEYRCYCNDVD